MQTNILYPPHDSSIHPPLCHVINYFPIFGQNLPSGAVDSISFSFRNFVKSSFRPITSSTYDIPFAKFLSEFISPFVDHYLTVTDKYDWKRDNPDKHSNWMYEGVSPVLNYVSSVDSFNETISEATYVVDNPYVRTLNNLYINLNDEPLVILKVSEDYKNTNENKRQHVHSLCILNKGDMVLIPNFQHIEIKSLNTNSSVEYLKCGVYYTAVF